MAKAARLLKIPLLILIGLILLVLIGLIALKFVNWSQHKQLFIQAVETFTDWQVEQLGDLEIDLYFPTRIRLEKVKLRQTSEDSSLSSFAADQFEISFDPLSIWFEERMRIHDIEAQGAWLVARQTQQESEDEADGSMPFIDSIAIQDSQIRYEKLQTPVQTLNVRIDTLQLSAPGKGEPQSVQAEGALEGLAVQLNGTLGSLLAFNQSERPFPIDLNGTVAGDELSVVGEVKAQAADTAYRLDVQASGNQIEAIAAVFGIELRQVPPYKLSVGLKGDSQRIELNQIQATLGYSFLYGSAEVQLDQAKPYLQADLGGSLLRLKDLNSLMPVGEQQDTDDSPQEVFTQESLDWSLLHQFNADVEIAVAEYRGGELGELISGLKATVELEEGRLALVLNELSLAEGTISGNVRLNDRTKPAQARTRLDARRLNLTQLVAPFFNESTQSGLAPADVIRGRITLNLNLRTQGETAQALASGLDGKLSFAIEDGAIIATLIEALGFDLTEVAASWLAEHPLSDIRCGLGVFEIKQGLISTQTLLLSTNDSNVIGRGTIDLQAETLDLTLQAHAKDFSFPSVQSPLHITGTLTNVRVDVISGELVARLAGAALLALVQPALGALPLLEIGLTENGRCSKLEGELEQVQQRAR